MSIMIRPNPRPAILAFLPAFLLPFLFACGGSGGTTGPGNQLLRDAPPSTQRGVQDPTLTVTVFRVRASTGGGGDAILVADSSQPRPVHVLVDAGGDNTAATYLAQAGIDTLDLMVLSHAHDDHYGGMDEVLAAVHVRAFAYNGQLRSQSNYEALLAQARAEADTVLVVTELESWWGSATGQMTVTLLPPFAAHLRTDTDDGGALNDGSLGVHVRRGIFTFLSTGDSEFSGNGWFAERFPTWVDVEAMQVGHHGSSDATQSFWLDATSPQVAVVSANGTTHPHGSVLKLLRAAGLELFCTPQHGWVTFRVAASGAYAVSTQNDPRFRCKTGSQAF
jgi:competence protein ComEC